MKSPEKKPIRIMSLSSLSVRLPSVFMTVRMRNRDIKPASRKRAPIERYIHNGRIRNTPSECVSN